MQWRDIGFDVGLYLVGPEDICRVLEITKDDFKKNYLGRGNPMFFPPHIIMGKVLKRWRNSDLDAWYANKNNEKWISQANKEIEKSKKFSISYRHALRNHTTPSGQSNVYLLFYPTIGAFKVGKSSNLFKRIETLGTIWGKPSVKDSCFIQLSVGDVFKLEDYLHFSLQNFKKDVGEGHGKTEFFDSSCFNLAVGLARAFCKARRDARFFPLNPNLTS